MTNCRDCGKEIPEALRCGRCRQCYAHWYYQTVTKPKRQGKPRPVQVAKCAFCDREFERRYRMIYCGAECRAAAINQARRAGAQDVRGKTRLCLCLPTDVYRKLSSLAATRKISRSRLAELLIREALGEEKPWLKTT